MQKAIIKELKSIEDSAFWTKTALSPEKILIPFKMVFKQRIDDKGNMCQFKAILMVGITC